MTTPAKKYIVLHPGAGGVQKRWPIEQFIEVAQWVRSKLDSLPVFVLGPVECELLYNREIYFLQTFPVLQNLSLEEFTGLLAGAPTPVGIPVAANITDSLFSPGPQGNDPARKRHI